MEVDSAYEGQNIIKNTSNQGAVLVRAAGRSFIGVRSRMATSFAPAIYTHNITVYWAGNDLRASSTAMSSVL